MEFCDVLMAHEFGGNPIQFSGGLKKIVLQKYYTYNF